MEHELELLQNAINALADLQNIAVYQNKEIERQVNWVVLDGTLKMLEAAKENS